jgi:hypothetical protein
VGDQGFPVVFSRKKPALSGFWASAGAKLLLPVWTPAAPCKELLDAAAARGSRVEMQVYSGAYHGFDRANSPVREFPEYRTSVGQCADAEGGGEVVVDDTGIAIRPRLGKQI